MRSSQAKQSGRSVAVGLMIALFAQRACRSRSMAAAICSLALIPTMALADVQAVTQVGGPPNLPIPTYPETGLPPFVMPVGTPSAVPSVPGAAGGGSGGGSDVAAIMDANSWGALAAQNAAAMGVNPTAIAATCVLESGCQNLAATAGSTVSGVYQMTNATYSSDIQAALAQNPSLATSIDTSLAGKMVPANQAIAAAQELKNAAVALQSAGIPNPTVLDTRGYYNFGPGAGISLARAENGDNMAAILSAYYSNSQLSANGITSSTTVGQWRQTITTKIGDAANQAVRI